MNLDELDPTFVEDLKASDPAVQKVAEWIRRTKGVEVYVPPIGIRPDVAQRGAYSDKGDIHILKGGRLSQIVEVRHRPRMKFDSVESYRYKTTLVSPVSGHDRKVPEPVAYFIVNADLSGALVLSVKKTKPSWTTGMCKPKDRGVDRLHYKCPVSLCKYVSLEC